MGMQVERVTRRIFYKLLRTYYLIFIRGNTAEQLGAGNTRRHLIEIKQQILRCIPMERKRHTVGQMQEIVSKMREYLKKYIIFVLYEWYFMLLLFFGILMCYLFL